MASTASIMTGDIGDHMRSKYTALAIMLVAGLLLANCAGSIAEQTDQGEDKAAPGAVKTEPKPADPSETPDRSEQRPSQMPPPGLERVEISPSVPMTGEVPDEIMSEIIADLLERTGSEQDDIQVVRAEAVVWNDGALGCPKPGEVYIQMLINGYWVVLEVEGVEYDYRVSDKGSFKLCEGRGGLPISPPENSGMDPAPDQ